MREREKTKGKNYKKIKHTIVTHFWYGLLKPSEKYKHRFEVISVVCDLNKLTSTCPDVTHTGNKPFSCLSQKYLRSSRL